jgi:hypothetical protein
MSQAKLHADEPDIDEALVTRLVAAQHLRWADPAVDLLAAWTYSPAARSPRSSASPEPDLSLQQGETARWST